MTPMVGAVRTPLPHLWVRPPNAGRCCLVCGWGPQAPHHRAAAAADRQGPQEGLP